MNAPLAAGSFAVRRHRRGTDFALPGSRRARREGAGEFAQIIQLRRSRHGAPRRRWPALIERECSLDDLVGETIDDYTITSDDVENALRPVLAYVEALLDQPGAEYLPRTPRRLSRPSPTPSAPPTSSSASATRSTSSISNSAPACASSRSTRTATRTSSTRSCCSTPRPRATRSPNFLPASTTIVLTILQPQSIEPDAEMVSSVTVTHAELDEFIAVYRAACEEALSPSPRLERGA